MMMLQHRRSALVKPQHLFECHTQTRPFLCLSLQRLQFMLFIGDTVVVYISLGHSACDDLKL